MRTRRPRALGGAALALVGLIGPQAQAAAFSDTSFAPCRVAVLPFEVDIRGRAEHPADADTRARAAVVETFDDRGSIEVVDHAPIDPPQRATCTEEPCQRRLAQSLDVDFVVAPYLELGEGEFSVTLALVPRNPARPLVRFRRDCMICSSAELVGTVGAAATDAMVEVLRRRALVLAPTPVPPRAPPSAPRVSEPSSAPHAPARPSRLTMAGLAVGGAGVATTLGGIVLLALDGHNAGCRDASQIPELGSDYAGCLTLTHSTARSGGALLGAGLVLASAGVTMFVMGRRARTRTRPRPRPKASFAPSLRRGGVRLRF